jgi:hypothetical protein
MPSNRQVAKDWGCQSSYVDRCVKRGCPTESFEAARFWRQANQVREPRKKMPAAPEVDLDLEPILIEELEKDLEGNKRTVGECQRLLSHAFVEGKPSNISTWMNLYYRAVEGLLKAEALIRQAKLEAGNLIPVSEAQAMIRKFSELIISRLTMFPQNVAVRCNPSAPAHAMDILQKECAGIIEDVQRAL